MDMKKLTCLFLTFILLLTAVLPLSAAAEEMWSEEYYRAYDSTGALSDAERDAMDAHCIELLSEYRLDLAVISITTEDLGDYTPEEYASAYYESCGFGYGENKDGLMGVFLADKDELTLVCFGSASKRLSVSFLNKAQSFAVTFREEHGIYGVMYALFSLTRDELADGKAVAPDIFPTDGSASGTTQTFATEPEKELPPWYPENIENFQFFNDSTAPRVVDYADLFSDEAESAMSIQIARIGVKTHKDIVIVTDTSFYGLGEDIYSADFYDFNGYGYGDEREGLCLFICMDPQNRCGWVCATGSQTRALYSYTNANRLDDVLYAYLGEGKYEEGVMNWIENVYGLYTTGLALAPDWYPKGGKTPEPFFNSNASRVDDEAGLLTEAEIAEFAEIAADLSSRYGLDVAIHTTKDTLDMDDSEYNKFYYACKGFGFGENHSGVLLTLNAENYDDLQVTPFGDAEAILKDLLADRLEDRSNWKDGAYEMLSLALENLEHLLKTGRVPRGFGYWAWILFAGLAAGGIFGGAALSKAKKAMASPSRKVSAFSYLNNGTFNAQRLRDTFLYATSTSRRIETESSGSSGSSHSGRSSYSSSYRGSSGSSHSGSGRHF